MHTRSRRDASGLREHLIMTIGYPPGFSNRVGKVAPFLRRSASRSSEVPIEQLRHGAHVRVLSAPADEERARVLEAKWSHRTAQKPDSAFRWEFPNRVQSGGNAPQPILCQFVLGQFTQVLVHVLHVLGRVLSTVFGDVFG
jgi:hypothetical protein